MVLDGDQLLAQRSPSEYGWTFTFTFTFFIIFLPENYVGLGLTVYSLSCCGMVQKFLLEI